MTIKHSVSRAVFVVGLVGLGWVGGLLFSGRLSVASPVMALPDQVPRTAPAAAPAAHLKLPMESPLADLSVVAEAALKVSANISSTTVVQAPDDPWSQFWGFGDQDSTNLGSGVVVSPDGYVLTNTHVIGEAGANIRGANIRVTLPDGKQQPGRLVGVDQVSDLAVVKVNAHDLPTLPWGDSDKLRVAEWVLAVGNPFQLSGTVTLGIVSTVSRSGAEIGGYSNFIQTDAAINPGNSGGALVDARGELVGINSMIYSRTGGYQGIGFAIPANLAQRILKELVANGAVRWGSIGDVVWITVDQSIAARYGLPATGAYVRQLARGSSAAAAGLRQGDIVVTLNGQRVTSGEDIDRLIIGQKIGSAVTLGVVRGNARPMPLTVSVVAREDQSGRLQ